MENTLRLFVSSLRMMAFRNYNIDPFLPYIQIHDEIERNIRDGQMFTNEMLNTIPGEIQKLNLGSYNFQISSKQKGFGNFSYIVENHKTGIRCLVLFFKTSNDSLTSNDLETIIKIFNSLSIAINGNSDFSQQTSRLQGIIIFKGKPSPIPKEKINRIDTLELINENLILSNPYDNIMQSQFTPYSMDETENFFKDPSFIRGKIPSVSKSKDVVIQYLDIREKTVVEINREKISDDESLDVSIYFREIK